MKRRAITYLFCIITLFNASHAWAQSEGVQYSIGDLTYSIPLYLEFQEVDAGGMKWHIHSDEASSVTYSISCVDVSLLNPDEVVGQLSTYDDPISGLTVNDSFIDNMVIEFSEMNGQQAIRCTSSGNIDDAPAYMTGIVFSHAEKLYSVQQIVVDKNEATVAEFELIVNSFQL